MVSIIIYYPEKYFKTPLSEGVPPPLTVLETTRPGATVDTETLTKTPVISPGLTLASNTRPALTPPLDGVPPQSMPPRGLTTGQITEN